MRVRRPPSLGGSRRGPDMSNRRKALLLGGLTLLICAVPVTAAVVATDGDSPIVGTSGNDRLEGTPDDNVLKGLGGDDELFGRAGDDRLEGGGGNDLIVGGRGEDELLGGAGDDTFEARDRSRDLVQCGAGQDRVVSFDDDDELVDCEARGALPVNEGTIELVDEPWVCKGPVNVDLVKVTMQTEASDAIQLRANCTGRIGRIEVDTWTTDGVKVNAPAPAAHDLVIEGGYIRCHGRLPEAHQDGIQVMGGERITFRRLEISCSSEPNAQLFINGAQGATPTDVVCVDCVLGPGAGATLFVNRSVGSGARNTAICPGRFRAVRIGDEAVDLVNTRNRVLATSDQRCVPPPAP